jgi:hypothetical protein
MELLEIKAFAGHVKEMRDLQVAFFDARKLTRWPDKKILAASKTKEREVDAMIERIIIPVKSEIDQN